MGTIGARHTRTVFVISGVQPVLGDFTTVFYVSSILGRDRRRNVRCVNMACPGGDNTLCIKVRPKVEYYIHMKRIHSSVIFYTMMTTISPRSHQSHTAQYALRAFDTSSGATFDCDPFWSERIYDNVTMRTIEVRCVLRPRTHDFTTQNCF